MKHLIKVLDHQLFDAKYFTYKVEQKLKRKKGKKGNLKSEKKIGRLTKNIFFMLMLGFP